jgi:hypothetical protein
MARSYKERYKEQAEFNSQLVADNAELRRVLQAIVDKHVKNIGTKHEYISMGGAPRPKTFFERRSNPTWRLWDDARVLLGGDYVTPREEARKKRCKK